LAKEAAENKQLKPRINKRNARFFGPGMEDIELGKMEVKKPERTWVRVGKGMGGVMRVGR
jgi:hypothetical protein